MASNIASMIIRGQIIEDDLIEFGGRGGSLVFRAPDPHKHAGRIPLASPAALADLYQLTFDDILDYLSELGARLNIEKNPHLRAAKDMTYATAPTTKPIIDTFYAGIGAMFARERVRAIADNAIGIAYLEGWVPQPAEGGTTGSVRAFGARSLHIIAGNSPTVAAETIIRNAITRSDAIIKVPSNDPFTAIAIGKTMCEMALDHPLTRHCAIAYWRGGDEAVEKRIYQPHNVEKIVAWGGFDSVKHVTKFIQPGLELISLDPKYSISIAGAEALATPAAMREAALRIAVDVGTLNQVGCVNARVVYVLTNGSAEDLDRVNQLGACVYEEMLGLSPTVSTKPKNYDRQLKASVDSIRLQDEWFNVIGGEDEEGCVIVSQLPEPVDFSAALADRTANIVPVSSLDEIIQRIDSYTQTIGVYPESLKEKLLNIAPLYGAQRIVSLGHALNHPPWLPHDSLELDRRLCKWIVNESAQPLGGLVYAAARQPGTGANTAPAARFPFTVEAYTQN